MPTKQGRRRQSDGYWTVKQADTGAYIADQRHDKPGEGRIPQQHLTSRLRRMNGCKKWKGNDPDHEPPTGGTWARWPKGKRDG